MTTTVFLHIDRTGGMAVRNWLAAQFPPEQIRPVPHHGQASYQPANYPVDFNHDLVAQHQYFVHNPAHKLVMGHWDAGILDKIPGDKHVITVLRDPAARAASLWRYICQEKGQYGLLSDEARQLGMVKFLDKYQEIWVNVMIDQLSGARWSGNVAKSDKPIDQIWVTDRLSDLIGSTRVNGTKHSEVEPVQEVRALVAKLCQAEILMYYMSIERCEIELQQNHLS